MTTVTLDDELLRKAAFYAEDKEPSAVVRRALKAFIAAEAARRLILLGGSDPNATAGPRRRSKIE